MTRWCHINACIIVLKTVQRRFLHEVVGEFIVVSVDHVMEAEHYIEYIAIDGTNINAKKFFNAGETAKAVFPYIKGSVVYAYCNKHGMWSTEVE